LVDPFRVVSDHWVDALFHGLKPAEDRHSQAEPGNEKEGDFQAKRQESCNVGCGDAALRAGEPSRGISGPSSRKSLI
jgi:hypothetical protein